jgi:hypothetical protein
MSEKNIFPEIDLHGVYHRDVKNEVIRFIENHWDSGESLKVITGNSPGMQKLVIEVANEYKLKNSIGTPFDTVTHYVMIYNV